MTHFVVCSAQVFYDELVPRSDRFGARSVVCLLLLMRVRTDIGFGVVVVVVLCFFDCFPLIFCFVFLLSFFSVH